MPASLLVHFESGGSYAPCMVIVSLRNQRATELVAKQVESAGGISADDRDSGTDLMSYEDAEDMLSPRQYRDLNEGWGCTVRLDTWTALSLFGYDCGDTLSSIVESW